jgi:hypothetical protein
LKRGKVLLKVPKLSPGVGEGGESLGRWKGGLQSNPTKIVKEGLEPLKKRGEGVNSL